MPLTMRPTGLGAGIDKDRQDFTIYSGGWATAGFTRRPAVRPPALLLVVHHHWTDDALQGCATEARAKFGKSWDT